MTESVACFKELSERRFGGNQCRWAVFSSFRNHVSWLESLYFQKRKHEWCDDVNDVAGVTSDLEEYLLDNIDVSVFKAGAVAALFGHNGFAALMTQTAQGGGFCPQEEMKHTHTHTLSGSVAARSDL